MRREPPRRVAGQKLHLGERRELAAWNKENRRQQSQHLLKGGEKKRGGSRGINGFRRCIFGDAITASNKARSQRPLIGLQHPSSRKKGDLRDGKAKDALMHTLSGKERGAGSKKRGNPLVKKGRLVGGKIKKKGT